jgi:hypothetical protein
MAHTNRHVLQDSAARRIIHTGPVDAHRNIMEQWTFSIAIWKQRNAELHGIDGAVSIEQRRKETASEAAAVYQATIGKVSPMDSILLHHSRIEEILKWTKEHLDTYLASADVIIDQRDEPG